MSQIRRQRRTRRKGFPRAAGLLAFVVLFAVSAWPALSRAWDSISRDLPSLDREEEYQASDNTLIFDSSPEPQLIAVLNAGESRIIITPEQIPDRMKQALVVIEDDRFYKHSGVDPVGMLRAVVANFTAGELVEGGSTITQQYIKNTYVSTEPTLQRKLKEAVYAYQLEQKWSKDRILSEYLNTIYFGNGAYGLQVAAKTYFNKPAWELTLPECALLAALPKSPTNYSPIEHPDSARSRRDLILKKMLREGMISQEEHDAAVDAPLPDRLYSVGPENAIAPYFIEYIKEQLIARYGTKATFEGGLRVYTTLDLQKQAAAEAAVAGVVNQPGDPSVALVSLEPGTSYIRAMVGGRDFSSQKFNVATQGHRQPGSAFKPFVLATAMNKGISPDTPFVSEPKHFNLGGGGAVWDVVNYDYLYLGRIDLKKATVYSDNAVYSELMMRVGPDGVAETAHKAGIKTDFSATPAIALGGLDHGVTPLELASAYGTFATGGKRVDGSLDFEGDGPDPISIVGVTDSQGNVLDQNQPVQTQVIDPVIAYHVNRVLKEVAMNGTGRWSDLGRPCAGKSGTTEDHVDAWFSGYTPDLVTTVWIGYPEKRVPMEDVRGVRVTGGGWPAHIWHDYMQAALAGVEGRDFDKPPNSDLVPVTVCAVSGQRANLWCPDKETRTFFPNHLPQGYCEIHQPKEVVMPELKNMKFADAWKILEGLGFEVDLAFRNDPSKPPDLIVDQAPKAGEKIKQGEDRITITVAGPPGSLEPPPMEGTAGP
jgi:penicillin-binding protein 1A